jgi:hypothetical protein
VGDPLWVEVLSPKFHTPDLHVRFFRQVLDDLFAQATRLPLTFTGPTQRSVAESLRPPTPLFTLHFLCQYAPKLLSALSIIQAVPYRELAEHTRRVPLAAATTMAPDVLLDLVQRPDHWVTTRQDSPLVRRLQGHAPEQVLQREPTETVDTPENRFVKHFLRQLLNAGDVLQSQPWWEKVPHDRQALIEKAAIQVRQVLHQPLFDQVGPMRYLPLHSQVLLRREGYREILRLWQRFQHARQPLFAPLQQAMEVRDIAQLYEMWVFFALIELLTLHVQQEPDISLEVTTEHGLAWKARARYRGQGTLVYNRGFRQPNSYSVPLRPDFSWMRQGQPDVVLDAKFRLTPLSDVEDEDSPSATAKRADLYKMHTYRDALDVRAAVALYPGTEALFYTHDAETLSDITVGEILTQDIVGIGALPLRPIDKEA